MAKRGTLIDGELIALQGSEKLQKGSVYEATGSLSGFMMQLLPLNWLQKGIGELYALRNSDVRILGVELNEDGRFRIQVTPTNIQMQGMGIAVAIAAGVGVSILAGMKVEQVWQVVTGTGGAAGGTFSGAMSLITVVGVVVLGVWVWGQYKQVSTS